MCWASERCKPQHGVAWHGKARRGEAWRGVAWRGLARHGWATAATAARRAYGPSLLGSMNPDMARQGWASPGEARSGDLPGVEVFASAPGLH